MNVSLGGRTEAPLYAEGGESGEGATDEPMVVVYDDCMGMIFEDLVPASQARPRRELTDKERQAELEVEMYD